MVTDISDDVRREFIAVIEAARQASADVGQEVEKILQQGRELPLNRDEAFKLLTRVITVLRHSASKRKDEVTNKALAGDINEIVERIIQVRERVKLEPVSGELFTGKKKSLLIERNRIKPAPVQPKPFFHGLYVSMDSGFVKTTDIKLWDGNERLDTHIGQFRHNYGRTPTSEELLEIMLSNLRLQGLSGKDQFKIVELARSIAANGVRVPPILDTDGTLLDGNRRVAACHYILNSNEFDSKQKQLVEYIFVWQLTEYTTQDERRAVIISLNFEADCKEPWPDYVKARKVHEEWQALLAVEPRRPGPQRTAELKRELSMRFALGYDTSTVNRYLKMVDWTDEFEEYHIQKGIDTYEVKHRADRYFQYFDELSKGTNPGGVAYTLNQDEALKHLAFDLLFQGKFKNWDLIRNLKYPDPDARDALFRARDQVTDLEEARDLVETVLTDAKNRNREIRVVGANARITNFVNWLENLPLNAFRKDISEESLEKLLKALRLVEAQASAVTRDRNAKA